MARLRHLVLSVDNIDETAAFYKSAFDLEETQREDSRIWLSDGVVSLAIIDANKHHNASGGPRGLNHFGFAVDDVDGTVERVLSHGGIHHDKISGKDRGTARQIKLKDPNGIYLEVVNDAHVTKKWYLPA
jgi:catechol-2,3-dioxygenase